LPVIRFNLKTGTLMVQGGDNSIHASLGGRQVRNLAEGWAYVPSLLMVTTLLRVFPDMKAADEDTEAFLISMRQRLSTVAKIRQASDWEGPEEVSGIRLDPPQRVGIAFLRTVRRAILGDGVGVGKTAQALLAADEGPVVVVCPKYLTYHWKSQATLWRPDLEIIEEPYKALPVGSYPNASATLSVVGYEEFTRHGIPSIWDREMHRRKDTTHFGTLIVDEAHRISNRNSQRSKAVRHASRRFTSVYLLTGTPIRRDNSDLWAQLNCLDPGVWGSYWKFASEFCIVTEGPFGKIVEQPNPKLSVGAAKIQRLKDVLEFYLLKRETKDVLPDLPDKRRLFIPYPLSSEQTEWYEALERNLALEVRDRLVETPTALSLQMRLRQICLDPDLVGIEGPSNRLSALLDILRDTAGEEREQVVVFTVFSEFAKRIVERLPAKYRPVLIHGQIDARTRDRSVSEFQQGISRVLVGTIGAMSEGLDFSCARIAVFTDLPWSSLEMEQAEGRLRRRGQERDVESVILYAPGTVEEDVMRIMSRKERAGVDVFGSESPKRETVAFSHEVLRSILNRRGVRV